MNGLKYVQYESYRNNTNWYGLVAFYEGYGFTLVITDDSGETVFEKFLKTKDINYCGNYLRKVVRNNFGAWRA